MRDGKCPHRFRDRESQTKNKNRTVFCCTVRRSEGQSLLLLPHHAAVDVLLHLAEGVWRRLALAGDDDADVGDGQRGVHLALRCPAVRDVDALGRIAADVGRPPRGRGLDEVTALLQPLLPLVQYAVGGGGER